MDSNTPNSIFQTFVLPGQVCFCFERRISIRNKSTKDTQPIQLEDYNYEESNQLKGLPIFD